MPDMVRWHVFLLFFGLALLVSAVAFVELTIKLSDEAKAQAAAVEQRKLPNEAKHWRELQLGPMDLRQGNRVLADYVQHRLDAMEARIDALERERREAK